MLVPPLRGSRVEATYAALVDGCIVTGLEADDKAVRALKLRQIPFVMVDVDAPASITSVSIDDCDGAYISLKHVLERGHRNIAIVSFESFTGRVEDYTGTLKHRFEGYRKALQEHGLSLHSHGIHVLECACSVAGGKEAMQRLMNYSQRPSVIIALSDVIAFGLIEAAREAGLRIPQDVSIVGFDDVEASRMVNPPLTTVRQPIREKGRRAAGLFVQMLRSDEPPAAQHIQLPVELIVRESCP
jgi:DNA-binding LacI/PurR family transcriptional regulator